MPSNVRLKKLDDLGRLADGGNAGKALLEDAEESGGGVEGVELEAGVNQDPGDDAVAAGQLQHFRAGREGAGPFADNVRADVGVAGANEVGGEGFVAVGGVGGHETPKNSDQWSVVSDQ